MGELALVTPTRLGRFEVVRHLASGGMADVLLARAADGAHVVIKRLRDEQMRDERFVRMFIDEAKISSYLDHPNIVRVLDIGDQGDCFFAMEYIHGEDLRKVLTEVYKKRDQIPIALVTGLVAGAAAGLHHAHCQVGPHKEPLLLVHRDVSPANIMVGYDGIVKVTDFGIAKAALRTVETRSGTLKGKVSYMSPEQVTGKPVDRRSDVFALGIVLYEVATARRLFKGDNDFLTMSSIVTGDIPRPSTLRPDLPKALEEIIMTALAGLPKDRFQTAEELSRALESFTRSLGMRMSAGSIADYMRTLFGNRAEPWLIDDEPTITMTIDFDGSESGVVQSPEVAIQSHDFPSAWKPNRDSPIAYALETAGGAPVVADPSSGAESWISHNATPPKSRGRLAAIALTAALVAGGGMFGVMKATGGKPDRVEVAAKQPETPAPATNPEPEAKPEPVPEAKPEPATPEPAIPAPLPEAKKPEPVPEPKPEIKAEPAIKKPEPVIAAPEPKQRPKPVAPKPVTVKQPPKKVATTAPPPKPPAKPKSDPKGSAWDPNALFAPK